MSTKLTYQNICGHKTTIFAIKDNSKILISVISTCSTIQRFGLEKLLFSEEELSLPVTKISSLVSLYEKITPSCFLPIMIINVLRMEGGFLSKTLAKKNHLISVIEIE